MRLSIDTHFPLFVRDFNVLWTRMERKKVGKMKLSCESNVTRSDSENFHRLDLILQSEHKLSLISTSMHICVVSHIESELLWTSERRQHGSLSSHESAAIRVCNQILEISSQAHLQLSCLPFILFFCHVSSRRVENFLTFCATWRKSTRTSET